MNQDERAIIMNDFKSFGFDEEQLIQIALSINSLEKVGKSDRISNLRKCLGYTRAFHDTEYADVKYNAKQLEQLRLGVESNLDVECYAYGDYSADRMYLIRLMLLGIDVLDSSFIDNLDDRECKEIALTYQVSNSLDDLLQYKQRYMDKVNIMNGIEVVVEEEEEEDSDGFSNTKNDFVDTTNMTQFEEGE